MSSSDDLNLFLRDARSWDEPGEETGAVLKEQLDRRTAAAAMLSTPVAKAAPRFSPLLTIGAAAAVGAACIASFVVMHRADDAESRSQAPVASLKASPVAPAAEEANLRPLQPVSVPEATVDVRDLPDTPPSTGPRRGPGRALTASSLEEESKLLRDARTARLAGAADRSLALTKEHASRFPDGALAPERDAERISALCTLGRREEALGYIVDFERRWSESALLERVRTSCRGAK